MLQLVSEAGGVKTCKVKDAPHFTITIYTNVGLVKVEHARNSHSYRGLYLGATEFKRLVAALVEVNAVLDTLDFPT